MSTQTNDNLKIAFAGESQANRKYLAYSKKAEQEGYPVVAALFRAAAEAETLHALAHFNNMGGVRSTLDNLKDAVSGETHEYTEMYPPMVEQAQKEGHKGKVMLNYALQAEKIHASLFQKALEALQQGKDLSGVEIYLCPICGDIEFVKPSAKCQICGAAPERFQRIGA